MSRQSAGHDLARDRAWMAAGEQAVSTAVAALDDVAVAQPSALPGWTRGHVISHLARNAEALNNLVTWARTGVPTPMYASPEARDADIEASAGLGAQALRADLAGAASTLTTAFNSLTPDAVADGCGDPGRPVAAGRRRGLDAGP